MDPGLGVLLAIGGLIYTVGGAFLYAELRGFAPKWHKKAVLAFICGPAAWVIFVLGWCTS